MKQKTGIGIVEELAGETSEWEEQERNQEESQKEEKEVTDSLEESLAEAKQELPTEDNPIEVVSDIKSRGLLQVAVPKDIHISEKAIRLQELPSNRKLKKGEARLKYEKKKAKQCLNYILRHIYWRSFRQWTSLMTRKNYLMN